MTTLPEGFWAGEHRQVNSEINRLAERQDATTQSLRNALRDQERAAADAGSRIGRLEATVAALVELGDVREQLARSVDGRAVRDHARAVISAITAGVPLPPAPPDVDGYWLAPAVRAVMARRDDPTSAAALMTTARARDAPRTDLALACIASVTDDPSHAADALASLLAWPWTVTRAERVVWHAAAAGDLGPTGAAQLRAHLMRLVADTPEGPDGLAQAIEARFGGSAVASAPHAAQTLATLRAAIEQPPMPSTTGTTTPAPSVSSGTSGTSGAEPDVDSAAAATADAATLAGDAATALARLLDALIDEGGPDEAQLLERSRSLRQQLGAVAGSPPTPSPWEPVGGAGALLLDDLVDASPEADARRRIAVSVLAAPINDVVERLAAIAADPPPSRTTVRAFGAELPIGSDGPDLVALRKATDTMKAPMPRVPQRDPGVVGGIALVIVGLLLGLVSSPGWLVLALAGAGLVAVSVLRARRAHVHAVRRFGLDRTKEQGRVDRGVADHAATLTAAAAAATEAADHATAIRRALASLPTGALLPPPTS